MIQDAAVIAVGNEFRRDDGVGPAVLAHLARHELAGVSFVISDGDPTQLLDAWAGRPLAVVIDAVVCSPSAPGRVHRTALSDEPYPGAASSTHGLGIPEAVRLAEALDRSPDRLIVYAVEAADVSIGLGLSPEVARAVPEVAAAVLRELGFV